jgi:hypothetical protein
LEKQRKEKEDQINELLKRQEDYEEWLKNEILDNKALEKDISKSKSNYLYETQLHEKEKQELHTQIEKLKFTEQYVSDNSANTIREYKDILQKEKEKAKEEVNKIINKTNEEKNTLKKTSVCCNK